MHTFSDYVVSDPSVVPSKKNNKPVSNLLKTGLSVGNLKRKKDGDVYQGDTIPKPKKKVHRMAEENEEQVEFKGQISNIIQDKVTNNQEELEKEKKKR